MYYQLRKGPGGGGAPERGGDEGGHMYVGTTWSCSCEHKKPRHCQKSHS
jgi:hypothetical protein